MNQLHEHFELVQLILTAMSGFIGIGIGIGIFKGAIGNIREAIKDIREDVEYLRSRQSRLRGEDNGGLPVYVSRFNCEDFRSTCPVSMNTKSIKALENFARWWMQKEGLRIEEVNQILHG